MIFEKIHTVPTSDELIDKAFRRATRAKAGKTIRDNDSALRAHESMVMTSGNILSDNLSNIVRRFPNFDDLPDFYYELTDIVVGIDELRQALGGVDWASQKLHEISREYVGKIRKSKDPVTTRKEAFGRMASVMSAVEKHLIFLNEARNILRKLPDVRDEPTIVVAGYPNVGKSSFVSMVTGARPEVASYPFTTKGVLIGHFMRGHDRYQVIDTPGLLDRPMSERNDVERQAITAIKYLDAVVLFIIDASETCGYAIEEQKRLLDEVVQNFELPIYVVANKADHERFEMPDFVDVKMSTATGESLDIIVDKLVEMIDEIKKEKEEDQSVFD
ncbi:NOG1 family protein [Methanococcoides sp. FTZ1]|uniref:NOG1 family protein n=1 Tax=Methanococcoides sp. FTZ1 TaxID=3439061 RepID=UPI003F86C5E6